MVRKPLQPKNIYSEIKRPFGLRKLAQGGAWITQNFPTNSCLPEQRKRENFIRQIKNFPFFFFFWSTLEELDPKINIIMRRSAIREDAETFGPIKLIRRESSTVAIGCTSGARDSGIVPHLATHAEDFLSPVGRVTIAELRPNATRIWPWRICCVRGLRLFDLFLFFWWVVFKTGAKIRVKNRAPLPAFRMDPHPETDLDAPLVSLFLFWKFFLMVPAKSSATGEDLFIYLFLRFHRRWIKGIFRMPWLNV